MPNKSPNQAHKIHIESEKSTDESAIRCECGFTSKAYPQFVHAVVQRHIQMVNNNASLEIARDF